LQGKVAGSKKVKEMSKINRMTIVANIIAAAVLVSGVSFTACQKEEKAAVKSEIKSERSKADKECIKILQVSEKGYKGSDHGSDKTCVAGEGRCWLWGPGPEDMDPDIKAGEVIVCFPDKHVAVISTGSSNDNGNDNGNEGQKITLDFTYQYNTMESLEELFDLTNNTFVIEEDIVEEDDSYLLELIGTTLPCRIPAGSYPITLSDDGIKVEVPVIY
jgi:hypothetical protein